MAAEHFETGVNTRCRGVLCSAILLLAAASLIGCLVLLGFYVHLHPLTPELQLLDLIPISVYVRSVDNATISGQQVTGIYFGYTLDVLLQAVLLLQNTNTRADVHVDHISVEVRYGGFLLGSNSTEDIWSLRRSTQIHRLQLNTIDLPVSLQVGYSMAENWSQVRLIVDVFLELRGRISTIGRLMSPPFYCRTWCRIFLFTYPELMSCDLVKMN